MSRTATTCRPITQRFFNALQEQSWTKTFVQLTKVVGCGDWTDGTHMYRTEFWDNTGGVLTSPEHSIWNGDAWERLEWDWSAIFNDGNYHSDAGVDCIWTDGTDIYYSDEYVSAVLRGSKWERKTWGGLPSHIYNFQSVKGSCVWTDGTNIYYSYQDEHLVLNGDTWEVKEWNGADIYNNGTAFLIGSEIWTDGTDFYWSRHNHQYVLNKTTDTWEPVTWTGYSIPTEYSNYDYVDCYCVWTDGTNTYLSCEGTHWIKNGYTWKPTTFSVHTDFSGADVWTDGTNIYCSNFVLLPTTAKLYSRTNGEWVKLGSVC